MPREARFVGSNLLSFQGETCIILEHGKADDICGKLATEPGRVQLARLVDMLIGSSCNALLLLSGSASLNKLGGRHSSPSPTLRARLVPARTGRPVAPSVHLSLHIALYIFQFYATPLRRNGCSARDELARRD